MVLDPEAEEEKVRSILQDLHSKLDGLNDKATTYKNHQKKFKVQERERGGERKMKKGEREEFIILCTVPATTTG